MIRMLWALGYVSFILTLGLAVYGAGHAVREVQVAPNGFLVAFHRAARRRRLRRQRSTSSTPRQVAALLEPLDRARPSRLRTPAPW